MAPINKRQTAERVSELEQKCSHCVGQRLLGAERASGRGLGAPWVLRVRALGERCRQSFPWLEYCSGFCRITRELSLRAEIMGA